MKHISQRFLILSFNFWLWTTTTTTTEAFVTPPLANHVVPTFATNSIRSSSMSRPTTTTHLSMINKRELEIRRQIMKLKKEGRIKTNKDDPVDAEIDQDEVDPSVTADVTMQKLYQQRENLRTNAAAQDYADKIKEKLRSSSQFGEEAPPKQASSSSAAATRPVQLGSLTKPDGDNNDDTAKSTNEPNVLDPSLISEDNEEEVDMDEMEEEDLLELVAKKMDEKRKREAQERDAELKKQRQEQALQQEANDQKFSGPNDPLSKAMKYQQMKDQSSTNTNTTGFQKTTTGVGGAYVKNETAVEDTRRPTRGSWGYFPRPKDISKAYGGGRKIVADDGRIAESAEATRDKLRAYREKVGIIVQSEKDHAGEIDEALRIGSLAMQRGMYSTAVSALEKVTKWCGTNSKVGGKVFLELAMAYEAVGRTDEAIAVYRTLTTCRIEDIKFNAKRLLYGIEAMNFMRDEAKAKDFSRKKAQQTFIDTTGLANIAENFDDRYNTAWVDLDNGFYRKLTESVVRSNREARQILLQAIDAGIVPRLKVVQALRSLSRTFDAALEAEIKAAAPQEEPVAIMNGKPILQKKEDELSAALLDQEFILSSASQMLDNINGEWKLQLLADKKGDGVRFYNSTLSWQSVDSDAMEFNSFGPTGFLTVSQSGKMNFNEERRIINWSGVQSSGAGGFLASVMSGSSGTGPQSNPHQILSVDSVLLITRIVPPKKTKVDENVKEFFYVWRRVEPGTYSNASSSDANTSGNIKP
mmetsp:Transcript_7652/g.10907  ORF Transcript_7652/g.10907 Transcript_7652/m.10907 type:complete len:754 (+) Transcript_7652:138-2399(+)